MSRSGWIKYITLVGVIFVPLSLAVGQDYINEYQDKSHSNVKQRYTKTEPKPEVVMQVSSAKPAAEIRQNASTPQENGEEKDYIYFGDGLAQWIMTIVSFLTLILSIWATVLLRYTLKETRAAVKSADSAVITTRDIGRAQSRSYLHVSSCSFERVNGIVDRSRVCLTLNNSGNSPSINIRYFSRATVMYIDDIDVFTPIDTIDYVEHISAIPANSPKTVKAIPFGIEPNWENYITQMELYNSAFSKGELPIFVVNGVIFYEDIFGVKFSSNFSFFMEQFEFADTNFLGEFVTIQADIPVFTKIENDAA